MAILDISYTIFKIYKYIIFMFEQSFFLLTSILLLETRIYPNQIPNFKPSLIPGSIFSLKKLLTKYRSTMYIQYPLYRGEIIIQALECISCKNSLVCMWCVYHSQLGVQDGVTSHSFFEQSFLLQRYHQLHSPIYHTLFTLYKKMRGPFCIQNKSFIED